MRELAGDRGIDAALDARAPADAPPDETCDQAKRRKLRQAEARTRAYLNEMREALKGL
jgi:hypothetical protein